MIGSSFHQIRGPQAFTYLLQVHRLPFLGEREVPHFLQQDSERHHPFLFTILEDKHVYSWKSCI